MKGLSNLSARLSQTALLIGLCFGLFSPLQAQVDRGQPETTSDSSAVSTVPVFFLVDNKGVIGRVNATTGAVALIGKTGVALTDIAFSPSGKLFGISFTKLYSINTANAKATVIGAHGILKANALVFSSKGVLYAAGNKSTNLFKVNPVTAHATNLGSTGFTSAGDLAFHAGKLYLSSGTNDLVLVDLANIGMSKSIGFFGFTKVYGLDTGDDGVLYGVTGTKFIKVNVTTGRGTVVSNYTGHGLGPAYGLAEIEP